MEAVAVVHLLVMRTSSTIERGFILPKLFRVPSGAADKSLPEHVMSAGMADESRTRGRVKLESPHLVLGWHLAKDDVWEALG